MEKQTVDTYEFTRAGLQLQGRAKLAQFTRFAAGLPPQDAEAQWELAGSFDTVGQQFLDLQVMAVPLVQCQRCMATMPYPLQLRSRLLVVQTEAELDVENPDASPDEWIEPVLASKHLDVLALVEDDLFLVYRMCPYQQCAVQAPSHEDDKAVEPSRSRYCVRTRKIDLLRLTGPRFTWHPSIGVWLFSKIKRVRRDAICAVL